MPRARLVAGSAVRPMKKVKAKKKRKTKISKIAKSHFAKLAISIFANSHFFILHLLRSIGLARRQLALTECNAGRVCSLGHPCGNYSPSATL